MLLRRFRLTALLVMASVMTGYGQSSPANRPWPPGVQKVSDQSPPLTPSEALKTFFMPPGYHLELVASEPLVQDPTVMDWDLEGRLWVVEMTGFVRGLDAPEPNLDRIGNVVVLEDTDRDGRMDKRTVFADGLILPRALKVLDRGVLVGEPGSLWLMRDTNGDLRVDTKELVSGKYGRLEGSVEGNGNGVYWGLDNRLHTTGQVDVYFRLKDYKFETLSTLARGEWGVTQDDAGRTYRNTNESALHVDFVPTRVLRAQPESPADARKLRGAARSGQRDQHRLAGASESRHQPRVSDRHRSGGRHARQIHVGLRAAGVPRRSAAGGAVRQRVCRGAGRELRQPHHPDRRRHDAAGTQGLRQRGVPGVDRRALPSGLPLERPRRDPLRRRLLPRHHPGPRLHDGVPARSHHQPQARSADRDGPHLPGRSRDDAARHVAGARDSDAGAARGVARAPQRLDARQRAAPARRARRDVCGRPADKARRDARPIPERACTRSGRSTASTESSARP